MICSAIAAFCIFVGGLASTNQLNQYDANCDGRVSQADVRAVRKHVAGLRETCAPDANLDGEVTAVDALVILQYISDK